MESVDKIIKDSDYVIDNLKHLERIHAQWVKELNESNWTNRPVGYENQLSAIDQQEKAFSRETERYLETRIIEWLSELAFPNADALEKFRDACRSVAKILTAKLKDAVDAPSNDLTLDF
ncbi:MAG: hypothetical protein IKW99_03750 [Bacteroidales bacterium]|nr:hypothetical protein [Bacteroidales bacterium]